jgi:hypothetical protein
LDAATEALSSELAALLRLVVRSLSSLRDITESWVSNTYTWATSTVPLGSDAGRAV